MNQISGLNLSELFYQQVVKPIMLRFFPEIKYACARMGRGSEVLGYDDSVSTDHDFGPCVQLFYRKIILKLSPLKLCRLWILIYQNHFRVFR